MAMSLRFTLPIALVLLGTFAGLTGAGAPNKRNEVVTVVYQVADLVVPLDEGDGAKAATLEGSLMDLIKMTVRRNSWKEQGGAGCLQYYPLGMALVVTQTREAQEEVADLLRALRRLQDVQVCIEMRIVQTSRDTADEFRAMAGFANVEAPARPEKAAAVFLTDAEVRRCLEFAQGDAATEIMASPRVTALNGQKARVQVGQEQSFITDYKVVRDGDQLSVVPTRESLTLGLSCGLQPAVSADRRSVQLKVDFRQTALEGPVRTMPVAIKVVTEDGLEKYFRCQVQQPHVQRLALKQPFTVPDGRTVVVSLGETMVETRTETRLPGVPFLRWVSVGASEGSEPREVFLLMTPRIIVSEEEEK
jgi:type II secretory pathway component GspD/PulD (secretin)